MYSEFINSEVVIIVSARTDGLWEYSGFLSDIDDNSLKLKNVEINQAMLSVQKSMFGSRMGSYKQNVDEVILNKNYIVACYKK